MCGFAGVLTAGGIERFEERLPVALEALRYRGPDDCATRCGSGWVLGFRRLSILDLSESGRQPMTSAEGSVVLVFNGEVYNYRELRRELETEGVRFSSSGDAEVVLRMLERHGEGALPRFNGMFALAFVDLRTRRFLLARDRLGVKPLVLWPRGDSLLFASELPSLLALAGERPAVSRLALNRYLAFGHIPPPLSIWDGPLKVPAGHFVKGALAEPTRLQTKRWWALEDPPEEDRDEVALLEELQALLADATRIRLVSDVPVGLFLSGGIDSGLVAYFAAAQSEFRRPVALTVRFEEAGFSEDEAATRVADANRLEHRRVTVSSAGLNELQSIARHLGEPFGDASVVNQFLLARAAREHATVFLTGDGGDEAFGGYSEYLRMRSWGKLYGMSASVARPLARLADALMPLGSPLRQRLAKLSAGPAGFGALFRQNFRDPAALSLLHPDWRLGRGEVEAPFWEAWGRSAGLPPVTRMQRLDYSLYLESDVLTKVDRATMAHSVEARSPFLDYRLVEWSARVSPDLHLKNGDSKHLLRALGRRLLPAGVADLPKRGFGLPIRSWFRGAVGKSLEEWLCSDRARSRGWWNDECVRTLLRLQRVGHGRPVHDLLWRALMLEVWASVFLDGDGPPGAGSP